MRAKKIHYQISGAGVLYQDSSEYLQSDAGRKQIETLKKLQDAFVKAKQKKNRDNQDALATGAG